MMGSVLQAGRWDPSMTDAPSNDLVALSACLPRGGHVLDIGCGAGARNAIYFAESGFSVEAVDSDLGAVETARACAARLTNLSVRQDDVRDLEIGSAYDLIICRGVLHFVEPDAWQRIFSRLRAATAVGGWHALSVFTDAVPVPPDLAPIVRGIFREGELRELYADWDVESAESYILEDEHPGGVRHRHAIDRLIARKPR